jgi:hypothetical protein
MPIATRCPACSKNFNLNDNMAGKRVKCPCGATMAVAAASAVPATSASKAGRPAMVASARTAVKPSSPGRSIFDELTENDFNRSPYVVPTAASVNTRHDAKMLNRMAGSDPEVAKADAESKGWFIFLGIVHIIWAMIYFGVAVLFIVASAALAMVEESLPILRLGMAGVVAGTTLFALWTAATGIGILMYKPWGWWLGVYSMFWGIFDRAGALALSLLDGGESSYRSGQYVGMAVGIIACISFLQLFSSARNRKGFKVQTPPAVALPICGVAALLISGGVSLAIYFVVGSAAE